MTSKYRLDEMSTSDMEQRGRSVPREAIAKLLTEAMDAVVANGADSRSMPDEYVEVAAWLCGIPAQPAPSFADAYQGAMEEVAIWKKRALEAEDLNRKFVAEINGPTYMGEPAQPAPSVPEDVMRDAERYRYLRARDDDTAGVGCWIEADGSACDRGWLYGVQLDRAIDSFIEVLAAAPKPEGE